MNTEDFSGSAIFDIKYSANTCIPIENTNIIVKIEKMNNMAILAKNGAIKVVLKHIPGILFLISVTNSSISSRVI